MLKTQRLYVRLQQHLRICRNPHRCSTLPQVSKISLISPFVWTLVECCEFLNTERKTFSWIKFAKIIPGSPLVVYLSSKSFRWLLQKKKKEKEKQTHLSKSIFWTMCNGPVSCPQPYYLQHFLLTLFNIPYQGLYRFLPYNLEYQQVLIPIWCRIYLSF